LGLVDERLDGDMRLAMRMVSLGRAARSKAGIKVRQPLATAYLKPRAHSEEDGLRRLEGQMLEELNVKQLAFVRDESEFVTYQIRAKAALLGPKYGRELADIQRALQDIDPSAVARDVAAGEPVTAGEWQLMPDEVEVIATDKPGFCAAQESGYFVAVPTAITQELADEGLARELVHRLQTMRRNAGFDIADRIVTYYQGGNDVRRVMGSFGDYLRQETLSRELVEGEPPPDAHQEEHTVDGQQIRLAVQRK
jgi:isoleucyl-tRNA synthetase